jgi:hypothetical protein
MSNCQDFKKEETELQYIGEMVLFTPTYLPVLRKRGCDNVEQLVLKNKSNVLTKVQIDEVVSRERPYISMYHCIEV